MTLSGQSEKHFWFQATSNALIKANQALLEMRHWLPLPFSALISSSFQLAGFFLLLWMATQKNVLLTDYFYMNTIRYLNSLTVLQLKKLQPADLKCWNRFLIFLFEASYESIKLFSATQTKSGALCPGCLLFGPSNTSCSSVICSL